MSNFKEILTDRLSEVEKMRQRGNETIKRHHIPEIFNFLAEHLNKNEEDPFSLAIADIWGSEIEPRNFTTEVYFFPETSWPSVCLRGEKKEKLFEKNGKWHLKEGTSLTILCVETLFSDPEKLSLEIHRIKTERGISVAGRKSDMLVSGSAQEFKLTENLNPEELLEEIVDFVVDPKKEPFRVYPLFHPTIYRYYF